MTAAGTLPGHGALMDAIYRRQKHIYDATRKYYLFGRDRLIAGMHVRPGQRVLELGCGTGRNLALIGRRWSGARLFGLDISREMLDHAQAKLGTRARLAVGDATSFDTASLFGEDGFDHIVLSYALSMIPDWRGTIAHAAGQLAPGGQLHIVDFGDLAAMPRLLAKLLRHWLDMFHVTPRDDMETVAARIAAEHGLWLGQEHGPLRYYRRLILKRR